MNKKKGRMLFSIKDGRIGIVTDSVQINGEFALIILDPGSLQETKEKVLCDLKKLKLIGYLD